MADQDDYISKDKGGHYERKTTSQTCENCREKIPAGNKTYPVLNGNTIIYYCRDCRIAKKAAENL